MNPQPHEVAAQAGNLEDATVLYIKSLQHCSYTELMRFLEPYIPVRGNMESFSVERENIIYYTGMSPEFCQLIDGLCQAGRIHRHLADFFTYLVDGGALNMPLAQRAIQYKKPRWLPIVFCTYPYYPSTMNKKPDRRTGKKRMV